VDSVITNRLLNFPPLLVFTLCVQLINHKRFTQISDILFPLSPHPPATTRIKNYTKSKLKNQSLRHTPKSKLILRLLTQHQIQTKLTNPEVWTSWPTRPTAFFFHSTFCVRQVTQTYSSYHAISYLVQWISALSLLAGGDEREPQQHSVSWNGFQEWNIEIQTWVMRIDSRCVANDVAICQVWCYYSTGRQQSAFSVRWRKKIWCSRWPYVII
jgi:hypothetical protein